MTKSAYIIAFVQALIVVAVAFGLDLTADQIAGIIGALAALLALLAAWHDPRVPFGTTK